MFGRPCVRARGYAQVANGSAGCDCSEANSQADSGGSMLVKLASRPQPPSDQTTMVGRLPQAKGQELPPLQK